jgi:hypothetical protein
MGTDDFSFADITSSASDALAIGCGYLGAGCLFIGGLSTFFPVPFIGQVPYLDGPTGSGFLYIICALLSMYLVYAGRFYLLYFTGGIAAFAVGYDIYAGTRLGYVMQKVFGGSLTASMGSTPDPIVAGMMQNAGFSIPNTWIILAVGIGLLMIVPNFARSKTGDTLPVQQTRDQVLDNRLKEVNNLITIYERGHITKEEFNQLKKEIMEKRN